MLSRNSIDVVEVEVGANSQNKRHVPFEQIKALLEDYEYFLFGIYEQVREWPENKPNLRRVNSVFISQKIILDKSLVSGAA